MPNLQRRSITANKFIERVEDTNLPIAVYDTDLKDSTPLVRLQNTISEDIVEVRFHDGETDTAVFIGDEFITNVSVDDPDSFDPILQYLRKTYS